MRQEQKPIRNAWVALAIFLSVAAAFLAYRQGACLVWNDSPNTCWFLYDRTGELAPPPPRSCSTSPLSSEA